MRFNSLNNILGWLMFAVATAVYALTAEPTGSLWDCGEFISCAYKLEVPHPPGAPIFLMVGRMFTVIAGMVSDTKAHPEYIAYSINLLSGICTALAVLFTFWITTILARLAMGVNIAKGEEPKGAAQVAVLGSGIVAALTATFCTSVWFSAVEGEVYAMSLFFTMIVIWAMFKWYIHPENRYEDRWMVFAAYMVGLSVGVHLLSLLTFPALALLYYYKKNKQTTTKGFLLAGFIGVLLLAFVQTGVILYLPKIGGNFDFYFTNAGMPVGSGLLFFIFLLIGGVVYGIQRARKSVNEASERNVLMFSMILLGFSTFALIMIRAGANTPINMNNPSDPYSLLSYLNREQYGERPLLYGPHFDAQPSGSNTSEKYGLVGDKYEVVDKKVSYDYNGEDMMLFPRIGHYDRKNEHRMWMGQQNPAEFTVPTQADNLSFFWRYQLKWEYWRYFMWNFSGRQNGNQGYFETDPTDGNWITGIGFIDNILTYSPSALSERMANDPSRNTYFMLPFLLGLLGAIWHFRRRQNDWWVVFGLFIMLGIAISIYSNQPPNEPRERDYAVAGSMMIFSIWVGLSVAALFDILQKRAKLGATPAAFAGLAIAILAPLRMGQQNWDDNSRAGHYGSRDYAANFLNSCAPNAIVFTYGDNDTYPLWYAQETEGIRTDVRVVNLSLLAVDWYINQLRRKMNNSPAIAMSLPAEGYRGYKRNQIFVDPMQNGKPMKLADVVKFIGEDHPLPLQGGETTESYVPTKDIYIDIDTAAVAKNGLHLYGDSLVNQIQFRLPGSYIIKDDMAILDIIANNINTRPIYWAVTCSPEKMVGLKDYMRLEGLATRLVPAISAGSRMYGSSPIGAGTVATDIMFENIMTKFKWGNFDKTPTHIDKSFMPSIISHRLTMLRLAETYLAAGNKEKAGKVVIKYFEAFPNFNFQYDSNTTYFLHLLAEAAGVEVMPSAANPTGAIPEGTVRNEAFVTELKKHTEIMAQETANQLKFFAALDPETRMFFERDRTSLDAPNPNKMMAGAKQQCLDIANSINDPAFTQKIKQILQ